LTDGELTVLNPGWVLQVPVNLVTPTLTPLPTVTPTP
jgi:hypothetical protein